MSKRIKILMISSVLIICLGIIFWFLGRKGKTVEIIVDKISLGEEQKEITKENQDNSAIDPEEENKNLEEKEGKSENINNLKITDKLVSWGFQSSSKRTIDTVIIHTSYNILTSSPYDLEKLIQEYKDYGVAPHYLIDRKGLVYKLVSEKNIAYHAGASVLPDGRKNVNELSIGIELMNTKTGKIEEEQYKSLKKLLSEIKSRYKIKYVLGHSDIAAGRKNDPWNFNWDKVK